VALQKLMPLFDRYLTDKAAVFHAELSYLGSLPRRGSPPNVNSESDSAGGIDYGSTADMIAGIERSADARERDQAFFSGAARALAGNDLERARALASRISQTDSKSSLIELADFMEASKAIRRKDLVEAERIANSRLSRDLQAVIYYTVATKWSELGDSVRANELMGSACTQAARVDDRGRRARIYLYLASGIARGDVLRAFEIFEAAIKDLDSVGRFDPADDRLRFELHAPDGAIRDHSYASGAGLLSVVQQLAQADLLRTIGLLRVLRAPAPRGFCVLSACRAILISDRKVKANRAGERKKPGDDSGVDGGRNGGQFKR